ncbi:uridine kinase [Coraliomargarita algicola]|uniref:Uridine kinase n=1 Tax=Coraliomargarita algicola TaxID=3092156 RepID=A0ABZ0RV26_9BACT|nr:uridine kinase [Coraliomargarita sp. J2-16]WPJ96814.1 uridine kinase [Coraliomargarita sp. J2-16]
MNTPKLILVAGISGSGKSSFVQSLAEYIGSEQSIVLSLDNYYCDLSHLSDAERNQRDFDQPDAWEKARLLRDISDLKQGKEIAMPIYNFDTHLRMPTCQRVQAANYIIAEGIFALCYEKLNELANIKIFVEIDENIALQRRIRRDTRERGRSQESVIEQFTTTVQPGNRRYILPSSNQADLIIPGHFSATEQLTLFTEYQKDSHTS